MLFLSRRATYIPRHSSSQCTGGRYGCTGGPSRADVGAIVPGATPAGATRKAVASARRGFTLAPTFTRPVGAKGTRTATRDFRGRTIEPGPVTSRAGTRGPGPPVAHAPAISTRPRRVGYRIGSPRSGIGGTAARDREPARRPRPPRTTGTRGWCSGITRPGKGAGPAATALSTLASTPRPLVWGRSGTRLRAARRIVPGATGNFRT